MTLEVGASFRKTKAKEDGADATCHHSICHDPAERLLLLGHWQPSLISEAAILEADRREIHRFLAEIERLRHATGSDGRDLFQLPLAFSLQDAATRRLDQQSMAAWLTVLNLMHPGLAGRVQQAELWMWGHGMVAPTPGYIWGQVQAASPCWAVACTWPTPTTAAYSYLRRPSTRAGEWP